MIYRPQVRTAEEILKEANFCYDNRASAGWVRYFNEANPIVEYKTAVRIRAANVKRSRPNDRLHALVRDGLIYLHYDEEKGREHKSHTNSAQVKHCISEFQKLDK